MPLELKNLEYIKNLSFNEAPDFGLKLGELLTQIAQGVHNIEQQTNSNATGSPQSPPALNSLSVSANHGHFAVEINHEGAEFYRGVRYYVEHDASPQFSAPHVIDLGNSRNASLFLGNTTRYFRAYAAYPGSAPGPIAYHGTQGQPKAVKGGGAVPGAEFGRAQGSGTGTAGQGHSGPGPIPYRTATGKPPVR